MAGPVVPVYDVYCITATDEYILGPIYCVGISAVAGATSGQTVVTVRGTTIYSGIPTAEDTTQLLFVSNPVTIGDVAVPTIGTNVAVLVFQFGRV